MTTYIFRKNIEADQGEPFPAGQKVIILTKERGKGGIFGGNSDGQGVECGIL